MRLSWTVFWLGACSLSCAVPAARGENQDDVGPAADPQSLAHEDVLAGGGRPVELDYKEAREVAALAGLRYGERVTADPAAAPGLLGEYDLGQAAEIATAEYDRGRELFARNARLESIAAHTRAVLLAPADARMYLGLGDALRSERFESRALAAYRTGLDLMPSAELHVRIAEIHWMRAEREDAIAHGLAALELDASQGRALADLARWYYFTNDYGRAWEFVHRCEAADVALPAQFRPLLASRMPEPRR